MFTEIARREASIPRFGNRFERQMARLYTSGHAMAVNWPESPDSDVSDCNLRPLILSVLIFSILTGCYDNTLKLWSTSGDLLLTMPGHLGPVKCVAWLDKGQTCSYIARSLLSVK